MAIKLFNYSGMDDKIIKRFLQLAKEFAGCWGDVVTKVTMGGERVGSEANECTFVAKWYLYPEARTKNGKKLEGWIRTDKGRVEWRPCYLDSVDQIKIATYNFWVAVHEYTHVKDFQLRREFKHGHYDKKGKYVKTRWKDRPHEQRAERRIETCKFMMSRDKKMQKRFDDIIALVAPEFDKVNRKRYPSKFKRKGVETETREKVLNRIRAAKERRHGTE